MFNLPRRSEAAAADVSLFVRLLVGMGLGTQTGFDV